MSRGIPETVAIAILAKAPLPGFSKTRLASALGADGAAALQARLIDRAVETARAARIGPVTLWAAPDQHHPVFQAIAAMPGVAVAVQPDGDLGQRMHAVLAAAAGPAMVIGTDCPVLRPEHLRAAADALVGGIDVVVIPVDDGGYALIGARAADERLFSGITWSTADVMAHTRHRLDQLSLSWRELPQLWDVDVPDDLERMKREGLAGLIQ